MNDKIKDQHLKRKAIVYVRQSTLQQVINNEESKRLQYAMQDKLHSLGWRDVEVIDDDLGRSAGGSVERDGFQRLLSQVSLGLVGAICARELSRFARNSPEWQQLVVLCRFFDTILIDNEAIYDTKQSNDRLLLGVKGTLNEHELDVLLARSLDARRAKAHRGELVTALPVGYVLNDERIEMVPDQRIRDAISLVFTKTLELGSARQTMLWLRENGLQLPVKRRSGKREVHWKNAEYSNIQAILSNPIYAGTYAYGKTKIATEIQDGRVVKRRKRRSRSEYESLIPDHHEGYVSELLFEQIRAIMDNNSQTRAQVAPGAAKRGHALLSGLLRCRRCGRKMHVNYRGGGQAYRYICQRGNQATGEPVCIGFAGVDLDEGVGREIVAVVQPAAVNAARLAAQESASRLEDVNRLISNELEAAQFAAQRAWEQYDAVDPRNRIVAAELERRWNVALEKVEGLKRRLNESTDNESHDDEKMSEIIASLASNLDGVWNDPDVDVRLKKRIARTLIVEIMIDVDDARNMVVALIHWQGGQHTELRVAKRGAGRKRSSFPPDVIDAVRALSLILDDDRIAQALSSAGLSTPSGGAWSRTSVMSIRNKRGILKYSPRRREAEGWLTMEDATKWLRLAPKTLQRAVARGELSAMHPLENGPWIFNRKELEIWSAENTKKRRENPATPKSEQLTLEIPSK